MWFGSREFLSTTLTDVSTEPPTALTAYDLALVPFGTPVENAAWTASTTYGGERGVWADGLSVGTYRIFARAGTGAPNERTIVALDILTVRNR